MHILTDFFQYEYPITDAYLKDLESKKVVIAEPEQEEPEWAGNAATANGKANGAPSTEASSTEATASAAAAADAPNSPCREASTTEAPATNGSTAPISDTLITQRTGADPSQLDEPMAVDVPFRAEEKKRLHWEGKTCM